VTDSYDEVGYKGYPFRQSHPDRMCLIGRLLGMRPAPAERCRVLELGCGDGGNLIPMAFALPESDFTGIDLAAQPIAQGCAIAEELGLRNIHLSRMDVRDAGPGWGEFDYIIAYGLYSWVPEDAQRKILEIAGAHLAPQGIAYINYNAYPGAHVRMMLRRMMLFETREAPGPAERLERARKFLCELVDAPALAEEPGAAVKAEARRLLERKSAALYHDELGEHYHPFYFHEFTGAAAAHGLQFLAEATLSDTHTASGPIAEQLECIPDRIAREQHLDFLKCRVFRHTLLCRSEVPLDHSLRLAEVGRFHAASSAAVSTANGETEFRAPHSGLRTSHPAAIAVLKALIEAWPRGVPARELPGDPAVVGAILLSAFVGGIVTLHCTSPRLAAEPDQRPTASPLARIQARSSDEITTLLHTSITIRDELARRLLVLLDGTRDRAALAGELMALAPPGASLETLAADVDRNLKELARLGLLMPRAS
jgi:cyclopropane fatty-acyl-phospholipid synthase-like methyltransferase